MTRDWHDWRLDWQSSTHLHFSDGGVGTSPRIQVLLLQLQPAAWQVLHLLLLAVLLKMLLLLLLLS